MLFEKSKETPKKAVAYYRHSAEDKQENSVGIQRDHANKFAAEHGIEIIHEEADEGVSGLTENRPAFQRLFDNWILNDEAQHFDYILVYDTSRWGRFQDPDKAAYLEQLVRDRSKQVVYIDRGFPKEDQKLISHLQSSIERYMSADYSRQLSNKVFYGAVKVSEQGYSAGGTACYGLSRLLLDESKQPIRRLKKGEHKMIANQRVTFTPTGDRTTETVKQIFHDLVFRWKEPEEIADQLNQKSIPSPSGHPWNRDKIIRILTNETYIGTRVYNKTWNRLKQGRRDNPRSEWIFCHDAFPSVVDPDVFIAAQERLYLLMPHKWNRGMVMQKKIGQKIRDELHDSFAKDGYDPDTAFILANKFPIISSITFYKQDRNQSRWVFLLPSSLQRFDKVVALGISLDEATPMREVFILPTQLFDSSGVLIVKEGDERYAKHVVRKEAMKDRISELTAEVEEKLCWRPVSERKEKAATH